MAITHPATTSFGPTAGTSHRYPPQPEPAQTSQPSSHSGRSSQTANDPLVYILRPTATVKRYDRRVKIGNWLDKPIVPALTTSFESDKPQDWTPLIHPEGALYWVYKREAGEWDMPVYTDAYLYDKQVLKEIERFREDLFTTIKTEPLMPPQWELVLDVGEERDPNERICYYYFVNPTNRSLFWLKDFDVTSILQGFGKAISMPHIYQALQSCYWSHWEMFPHDREVPEKLLKELIGIMVHAGIDEMSSHESTSVYAEEELRKLIHYVKQLKFVGGDSGYSACVVGRLMRFLTQGRFINLFGQHEARLSADQSILKDKIERTWFIKTMCFLLFFAPGVHLKALDSLFTDFVVCHYKSRNFFTQVQNEWRELSRIGTVLLTANVAFLAIPSIDSGKTYVRSPAQVTSFMSVVFSLGCIVTGQFLLRYHTIRPKDSAEETAQYLLSQRSSCHGFETLAIIYSLPYSFLLWALVSFFVAFVFVALVDSEGIWQRYPTAAVIAVFIFLLALCYWRTWEGRPAFVARLCRFLERLTMPDEGVSLIKSKPVQPNGSANMV